MALVAACILCLLLALLARRLRAVDGTGACAGAVVALLVWVGLGWGGLAQLGLFVGLGTLFTRLGFRRKLAQGIAQAAGGRRGLPNVLANLGVASVAAGLAVLMPGSESAMWRLAASGALATALADTTASELGQLWGRRAWRVTDWRPVPVGTEGAISVAGTLLGAAAGLLLAAAGPVSGLYGWTAALVVALAGTLGNLADSFLGATLETRGVIDNEGTNLLATLVGAVAAVAIGR